MNIVDRNPKENGKIEEIKAVLQSKGEPDWSNCCQFYMEKVAKLWEKKWKNESMAIQVLVSIEEEFG